MGNQLEAKSAGRGAVIGLAAGLGPVGAVIGAVVGRRLGATTIGIEAVGKPIKRTIKAKTSRKPNKSPVDLMNSICRRCWSIGVFIEDRELDGCDRFGAEHAVIDGIEFSNFVPIDRLKNIWHSGDYDEYNEGYTCGLNAINMSLRIWGYDKQMSLSQYSYKYPVVDAKSARWGMTGQEMYDCNIKNTFDKAPKPSWEERGVVGTPSLDIGYVNGTDYTAYTLMFVSGTGLSGHYMMVIGVSVDKDYYLITDQSRRIWLVSYSDMKDYNAFYYRSNAGYSMVNVRSYYRMG